MSPAVGASCNKLRYRVHQIVPRCVVPCSRDFLRLRLGLGTRASEQVLGLSHVGVGLSAVGLSTLCNS